MHRSTYCPVRRAEKPKGRLPPKIIDYVVVHELCHTKVPNHSPAYWHIVGLVIPDYKNRKEWLRMNRQVLIS